MDHATPATTTTLDDRRRAGDLDEVVEELALLLQTTIDDDERADLREQMVLAALSLADSVALRYQGRGIETDDLVQVARTALVKAVHRYRPGAGPGFAAFAAPTISGEIKRWFRDQGWAVRPPRRIQELRAGLVVEEERLRHELRRDPCDQELAGVLAVSAGDVAEARACSAGYHATSLDALTSAGTSLADHLLVVPGHAGAFEVRDALRRSIACLDQRQRLVLRLRFVDELTQCEIGERIGVSQMQVSRILRGILDRLRLDLVDDDVPMAGGSAA
jgi:RNA polymerase sigma-B factor